MKRIVLILLVCFILSSCEKEKLAIIENKDMPLIGKVLVHDILYYENTYNDGNLISEEKSKFHYTKHEYNDKDLLIESDFYVDPWIEKIQTTEYSYRYNQMDYPVIVNSDTEYFYR